MGLGQSNNYNERDFEEKPLEDEEIETLLEELPSSKKLMSLTGEEKIKILKATSDEKIYNTVGDDIFDYYFTNNKEAIKGCMKGHINRDGTPCPDEKFIRMITTIPNLVQGPLGEKENQWNTEKNNLKSQYDTLEGEKIDLQMEHYKLKSSKNALQNQLDTVKGERDTLTEGCGTATETLTKEKTNLQTQYDTLNTEKTNLQTQYDTLNTEKGDLQTQYDTLNTQKGDLQTQYDELNTQKNTLQGQYDTLITQTSSSQIQQKALEVKVKKMKEVVSNLTSNFIITNNEQSPKLTIPKELCKLYATNKGYNFAISSESGNPKGCFIQKPNMVYYNRNKDSTTKCNAHNGVSQCIEDESKYFLEVHNEYENVMNVSKEQCDRIAKSKYGDDKIASEQNWGAVPEGCVDHFAGGSMYFNKHKGKKCDSNDGYNCIQTPINPKDYDYNRIDYPNFSVSEAECAAFSESKGMDFYNNENSSYPQGCYVSLAGKGYVRYNPKRSEKRCSTGGAGYACIQKKSVPYKFTSLGKPRLTVSKDACEDYAKKIGSGFSEGAFGDKPGCFFNTNNKKVYYSTINNNNKCNTEKPCIELNESLTKYKEVTTGKPDLSVTSASECKAYAESKGYPYNDYGGTGELDGCWINTTGPNVYYTPPGKSTSGKTCSDSSRACIQKNDPFYGKFRQSQLNRKPLNNVGINECQGYAKNNNFNWRGTGNNNEPKGCFLYENKDVWYNENMNSSGSCDYLQVHGKHKCIEKEVNKDDFILKHSGTPVGDVNKEECMQYSIINNKNFSNINNTSNPAGCFIHTGNKPSNVYFNSKAASTTACDSNKRCIIKNKQNYNLKEVTSGKNDDSVNDDECKGYSKSQGVKWVSCPASYTGVPKGCGSDIANGVKEFKFCKNGTADCNNTNTCVQKGSSLYYGINSGKPDLSLSESECEQWAKDNNKTWGKSIAMNPTGGYVNGCFYQTFNNTVKFNKGASNNFKCGFSYNCIQKKKFEEASSGKPDLSVTEVDCKAYADSINYDWDKVYNYNTGVPRGCIKDTTFIKFNPSDSSKSGCSSSFKCIKRK